MTRQSKLVLAAGSALALVTTSPVSGQNNSPDLLERRIQQLAGPNAVDCGRIGPREEPAKATDCALAANDAGKPFHVRYDMQGIDSYVAVAFVRSADGTVQSLSYDSDPMGGAAGPTRSYASQSVPRRSIFMRQPKSI